MGINFSHSALPIVIFSKKVPTVWSKKAFFSKNNTLSFRNDKKYFFHQIWGNNVLFIALYSVGLTFEKSEAFEDLNLDKKQKLGPFKARNNQI